jgi:hypothetical protein
VLATEADRQTLRQHVDVLAGDLELFVGRHALLLLQETGTELREVEADAVKREATR